MSYGYNMYGFLIVLFFFFFTDNILKYYRVFDMYVPEKMMEKKTKSKFFISSAIDKIRKNLEIDKYQEERKRIGKD